MRNESSSRTSSYKCEKCMDTGWIIKPQTNSAPLAASCECREREKIKSQWKTAGINPESSSLTFSNFIVWNEASKRIKDVAFAYYANFNTIRKTRKNSLLLCGQVGSGKTHATVALAINFIKKDIKVVYMPYSDTMTKLKQNKIDGEYYQKLISRYKRCEVLLVDDLFKGRINEVDIGIMSEIINYRYDSNLPVIVSTEFSRAKLWNCDEGVGSKITEMCRNYTVEIPKSRESNYRLR